MFDSRQITSVIVPANNPNFTAHTYTQVYGGTGGGSITINNQSITIGAGKIINIIPNSIQSATNCFLLGYYNDGYNESNSTQQSSGYPYTITFRSVSSLFRQTYTVTSNGFTNYSERYMTITPSLLTTNPIAPARVEVYSYSFDLQLVTAFDNGISSSNKVGSTTGNQTNFSYYYGTRTVGGVTVVNTNSVLRVRVLDKNNVIIAETNFLETSNNTTNPTIVSAP